jgi:hypothetical protein
MSDRVCGTCGMRFEYPYLLERHINGKRKCKPIDNSRSNFHCQYCNNNYASKYSINNHQKICKAKIEAEVQVQNNQQSLVYNISNINTENYVAKVLSELSQEDRDIITGNALLMNTFKEIQKTNLQLFNAMVEREYRNNNLQRPQVSSTDNITVSQSANTLNNILNPTINNITSNTSNTSNINIQTQNNTLNNIQNIQNIQNTQNNIVNNNLPNIIYPFDYEDISFITDDEKLNILTSSNGVEQALEKIYSKPENRNFYRQNANKDNVSILGKDMKIQIKNLKQFNEQILNKGILLMERMFHSCKNRLSFNDQLLIWNNIEQNRELLAFEHYLVNIINLIETCFRDPISKDIFKKFSDKLYREEIYRKDKINIIKNLIIELERFNQDKTNITIDDDFLRTEVWSQEEHKNKDADEDDLKNNLDLVRIEDTPRFKFFNDMRTEEIEYFDMHGASIGNIIKYRSILLQRAKTEIDRINKIYNNDSLGSEVRDKLITQPNDNMLSHLRSIKFSKALEYTNNNTYNTITT